MILQSGIRGWNFSNKRALCAFLKSGICFPCRKHVILFSHCTGSGWDRVNFLPSSCYGAMFLVTRTVLITPWYFSSFWTVFTQHQGLLSFSLCLLSDPPQWLRGVQGTGRHTARQVTQKNWRDIPCHIMSCSAINWRAVGFREVTQLLLRKWLDIDHGWWWVAHFTLFFSTSTSVFYVKQLYDVNI